MPAIKQIRRKQPLIVVIFITLNFSAGFSNAQGEKKGPLKWPSNWETGLQCSIIGNKLIFPGTRRSWSFSQVIYLIIQTVSEIRVNLIKSEEILGHYDKK